ncbi:hypothetical protein ACVWVY_007842 [Bradyrhizobium sp. URHC0002]|jgi:hypothetical protein
MQFRSSSSHPDLRRSLCSLNSRKLSVGDSAYAAEEITAQMCWAFYVLESTTGTCMEVRPISTIG